MAGKVTGGGKGRPGPRQPGYMKKGGKVGGPDRPEGKTKGPVIRGQQRPEGRGQVKTGRVGVSRDSWERPEGGRGKVRTGRPVATRDSWDKPEGGRGKVRTGRPGVSKEGWEKRASVDKPVRRSAPSGRKERPTPAPKLPPPRAAEPKPQYMPEEHAQQRRVSEEVVAGINPVLELLRSDSRPLDALYIDKEKGGKPFEEMVSLARRKGVQVKVVPRQALDGMAGGLRHQGALAQVPPKPYADPREIMESAKRKDTLPLILILDGVEDPQNLGAIIRTAEAAGVNGVVIPEHRAAHLTATVARASAGALEHMPVAKVANLANYIISLKERGFWVIGFTGEGEVDYTSFDMRVPLAVVMGGEGAGIRPVIRKSCDALLSLPMLGKVSSLNVSVATGVALYEVIRQRKS